MNRNLSEMRVAIDEATEGGLYALNRVSKSEALEPGLWVEPGPVDGTSRYIFYAVEPMSGRITYFDTAVTPTEARLDAEVRLWAKGNEVKKRTAQVLEGLRRLDEGLDPEVGRPDPSLN